MRADDDVVIAAFSDALPTVYGYLLRRCRDRSVAEDLTSETLLAGVAQVRSGRSDLSIAWLIGIARHKLVDHWRRLEREHRRLQRLAGEHDEADGTQPLEPGRAHDALERLSPMHRAALTLRHVDGLPVAEVAEALGRSVHATETLLVRARAAFRHEYDGGSHV